MTARLQLRLNAGRWGVLIGLLLLSAAACGEYQPTNPYDARFANTLTLEGPDTTYSVDQVVSFTVSAQPAWPNAEALWASSNPDLKSLGGGRFQVMSATHDDEFATVTATLGTKMVSHSIRVRQRTARMHLQGVAPITHPDSTFAVTLGARMSFTLSLEDSAGHYIPDTLASGQTVASIVVRDTTVATLRPDGLYSRSAGRTWLVGRADGRTDSLVIRVAPPTSMQTTRGAVELNPGESASPSRLVLTRPSSPSRHRR